MNNTKPTGLIKCFLIEAKEARLAAKLDRCRLSIAQERLVVADDMAANCTSLDSWTRREQFSRNAGFSVAWQVGMGILDWHQRRYFDDDQQRHLRADHLRRSLARPAPPPRKPLTAVEIARYTYDSNDDYDRWGVPRDFRFDRKGEIQ